MPDETNENGVTFDEWYRATDASCVGLSGVGIDDIPDGNSWDAWNDCETPRAYAVRQLEEDGFPFDGPTGTR